MDFGFCGESWDWFTMDNKKQSHFCPDTTQILWSYPSGRAPALAACASLGPPTAFSKSLTETEKVAACMPVLQESCWLASWRRPVPYEGRLSWHSVFLPELISSLEVGVNVVYSQMHMQPLVLRSLVCFCLYWRVGEGWRENNRVCRKNKGQFCRGDGVWAETWRKDRGLFT